MKLQEQGLFAAKAPAIANAANAAARKKLIAELPGTDPALYQDFHNELRKASGWSYFLRESGRFPLTGHGDVNITQYSRRLPAQSSARAAVAV